MTGGVIRNNKADISGAGAYLNQHGNLTLQGTSVADNNTTDKSGAGGIDVHDENAVLTISGNTVIASNTAGTGTESRKANVYLTKGRKIVLESRLADTASIGVTTQEKPTNDK